MIRGRLTVRRRMMAPAVVSICTAAALAGCGGGSTSTGQSQTRELTVVAVGAQLGDAYKQILSDFGRKFHVKTTYVEQSVPTTVTKLAAQERAHQSQYDVAMLNNQAGAQAKAQGLTQPLDPKAVPNLAHIAAIARPKALDGPYTALSLLGIAYSQAQFASHHWPVPTRWADFLDPRYGSCVVPPDPVNAGSGVVALALINKAVGGSYTAIDKTVDRLRPSAGKIPSLSGDLARTIQQMSQGSACLGVGTQGVALEAVAAGEKVGFTVPRGNSVVGLPLVIPKSSAHVDLASKFINYVLSPAGQQIILERALWSPVRTDVTSTNRVAKHVVNPAQYSRYQVGDIPPAVFSQTEDWGAKFADLLAK